jgi:hypothetical protein
MLEARRSWSKQWFFVSMVALVAIVLMLTLGGYFFVNYLPGLDNQPLRADAQTLYMADWSKDLDSWSGGAQWHWQEHGVISSDNWPAPVGYWSPAHYHEPAGRCREHRDSD